MNILFLCISFTESNPPGMYESLLSKFLDDGHNVYIAIAAERKTNVRSGLEMYHGMNMLRIRTGNLTGDLSLIEKGISTISVDWLFQKAINKYLRDIVFDLIIYPTPPITLVNTIEKVKMRTHAKTYLLLKDIFPQNAVDLNMMSKSGPKKYIYHYFRKKEKKLYVISDYIGCMSPANCSYVIEHNQEISPNKVEVCPNCIRVDEKEPPQKKRNLEVRRQYNIPNDAVIFLYGGNLGKPQGIPFLIECLKKEKDNSKAFYIIIGAGSEYGKLQEYIAHEKPKNAILLKYLPKDKYQAIVNQCDVGMIFLDHRFTIPNFPSRLLSYLRAAIPVLVVTDTASDMGQIAEKNKFGKWCESNNAQAFSSAVNSMISANREEMGMNGWHYLIDHYTLDSGYRIIQKHFE